LKERQLETGPQHSEVDTQKLIHELKVHQIELELQFEELDLAKEQAEVASEKYAELYDFAPTGYFTLSKPGEIIELNHNGAQMLGKERSRLKNSMFGFFVSDDTKPIFNLFLEKVFNGKAKELCEVTLSPDGNSPVYIQLTGIVTGNGKQCFISATDISKRKQAEEKRLESSEERYRLLYENANIGLYRTTPDGTIVLANKALVKMLGYPSFDELAKVNVEQDGFETPHQRKAFLEKIEQTGEVENFESTWIRQDRTPVFVRESARAIRDTNGNTLYYDGTVVDITKRKQAEDALIESEEKYRALFETSLDGISLLDLTGKIVFANNQVVKLFGYNQPSEFIGLNGFGLIHPEDKPKMDLYFKEFMTTGVITNCEVRSVKKDGSEFIGEYSATLIKNANGDPVYMMDVVRDITERKRVEAALRDSEARYHLLFEKSADGILIADVETKMFKYANPALCRMLGYDEEELRTLGLADIHPQKDLQHIIAEFESQARGEKILAPDIPCLRKDGSIMHADITTSVITMDGRACAVGLFRDITERKQAEEALKSALERNHRQQEVVTSVAVSPQLAAGDVQGLAHQLNEHAAKAVDVERVSLWLFNNDETELRCVDLYEHFPDRHSTGAVLLKNEYTNEFEALKTAKYIDANDPLTDPRTAGYVEGYLKPLRITSMLDAVIREGNRNIGVLCFEHVEKKHNWELDEISFASQLADQIALTVLNHERILAEESFRQSEIKLQVIIESTADGILAIDGNGKVIKTNNRFAELWKIPPAVLNSGDDATLLTFVLEQLISPKQFLDKVQQLYNSTDEDSDTLFFKDGRIFERYSAPLILDDKIIGRVWSFRDITERKRAEEALRESKNIIQNIIDNSPSLIYILDLDGKFILANKKLAEVLNFSAEKLLGNTRQLVMPTEFAVQHRNNDLQVIDTEQEAIYEEEIEESDGVHTYLTQKFPLFDLEGKIYAVGGISTDITERKQTEEAIFKAKEQYRLLVESAPDIIFTIAIDGTFTSLSPAFETLLSWLPEEWIGKPFAGLIHPDDLPLLLDIFQQAMQGVVPSVFESRVLTKQGDYLYFEYVVKLISENGEIKGIMGISRHITERKKSEEKLNILALAIKNSADCIAITDKDYKIIFVNDSFCIVYGFEKEEIIGQPISVITSRNNLPEVGQSLYSAMARNEVWSGEVLNKRKDGNDFPVQLSLAPVITDKGELIAVVGVLRDITERRRAEEALHNSEQRYRLLIETANEGILVAQNGFLKFVNPMMQEITGFTHEELLTLPFIDYVHPGDRKLIISNHLKRLNGDMDVPRYHYRFVKKDGSIRWIEMNGIKIEWEGQPATLNMLTDITERKQAEETLQHERTLLRLLIDNVPDLMYTKDTACHITLVNIADVQNMGVKLESEVLGKDDFAFFPKEMAEEFYADDKSVIETGQPLINKEEYTLNEFGQKRWFLTSKFPLRDQSGKIIGLAGIGRDITQHKQAEEELRESEERFRRLFELSPEAIVLIDPFDVNVDWPIVDCNESACKMNGYTREELIGKSIDIVNTTSGTPEERAEYLENLRHSPVIHLETFHRHRDGHIFPIDVSTSIETFQGHEMVLGIDRDITERKLAEEEIRLKNQQLLKLNAEKDKFFSIVSHDLRSPFNSFLGMTQLMAEDLPSLTLDQIQEFSVDMRNSATNLYRLLENLLQWSRMQQGSMPFEPEVVKLNQMVGESIEL